MSKEHEVGYAHRSRMDMIANILRVASGENQKTLIMPRCNLSFKQLHAYLNFLVSIGLLKSVPPRTGEKSDSNAYETTEKGESFIQAYRRLESLLAS